MAMSFTLTPRTAERELDSLFAQRKALVKKIARETHWGTRDKLRCDLYLLDAAIEYTLDQLDPSTKEYVP
jgi:hypothetical protein